tara:strand:- start:1282 stop:2223 length:942 start_codon:yes stop_codon:yes gene_type:complete
MVEITDNKNIDLNKIEQCCDNPILCKHLNELLCKNCGLSIESDELIDSDYNDKNIYNNCIRIVCNKNVKNIFLNDSDSYKYIRYNSLLTFLKEKNKQSIEMIHENILKQSVEIYIKITENKILRANNLVECLSYILFRKCIDFNNPKTHTFIVNYMNLPKGGFSRGLKRINLLLNENLENNNNQLLINDCDDLIKLKSFANKMIVCDDIESFANEMIACDNIEYIYPIIIKLYNFTNKLCVFNEFRNDTKITGCIWYLIKLKDLKINNTFFKKNKIEKNTVKKFYKKIIDSEYNSYYILLINNIFNVILQRSD